MKPRTAILAVLCLATSWYYAISLSSTGGVALKPGAVNDFFQVWNASRAILHHANPYGPEVTYQNQIAAYGAPPKAFGIKDDRRTPYPVPATFPLLLLGFLDFRAADKIALWLLVALTVLSVGWLRGRWDRTMVLYCALTFSCYPVIYGLQARQPTLLFFGLAVGSFALLRSGRLIPAAMLAALSAGKPQIALPVLLPMLIWTLARWHARKRFAIAFATSLLALLAISSIVSPGWMPEWLDSLRDYSQYHDPSIAGSFFGNKLGLAVSGVLLFALAATLWLYRECDLLFQMAVSVAIFCLIIPSEIYNAAILLIPAVWVADNAHRIKECGAVNQLALAVVRVAFIELWLGNAVGALLLHTTPLGKSIAWRLCVDMVFPVLGSLVAVMIVQCLTLYRAQQRTAAAIPAKVQAN